MLAGYLGAELLELLLQLLLPAPAHHGLRVRDAPRETRVRQLWNPHKTLYRYVVSRTFQFNKLLFGFYTRNSWVQQAAYITNTFQNCQHQNGTISVTEAYFYFLGPKGHTRLTARCHFTGPKKVSISRTQPPSTCPRNRSARIKPITHGAV